MARWMRPEAEQPECYVGDRVVLIVEEVSRFGRTERRIVVLEATEGGWTCGDDDYLGYSPGDGLLWSLEKDICQIADVILP